MTVCGAAKRQTIGFNNNFAARPLGIGGFKIQTAFTVVVQRPGIFEPRTPVFKRNRSFTIDASASSLQGTASHPASPLLISD
jgi:hypothetical protein